MELSVKQLLNTNFVRVNSSASVSEMLGALAKAKQTHAVVFDDSGNYLGISSKQAVLRKKTDLSRMKVENVVEKKPLLAETDLLQKVAEQMIGSDSKILPVGSSGKIAGVVFAIDVIKQIKSIKGLRELKAKEVANSNPIVLPFDSTLGKLINTMQDMHVSKIPIVGKNNELKGIISFSDLMESYLLGAQRDKPHSARSKGSLTHDDSVTGREPLDLPITDWLVSNVKTVSPNDKLPKIIDTMVGSNISDVILVEKGSIKGMITLSDLLESFVRLKKERKNIQYISLPELDEIDSQFLNNAIAEAYDKIRKRLGQITYFVVHFKTHESEGLRRQTTIHLRLSTPRKLYVASSTGWVLLDALHDAIKNLEREAFGSKRR